MLQTQKKRLGQVQQGDTSLENKTEQNKTKQEGARSGQANLEVLKYDLIVR